jgi:hypothetical protein
MRLLGNTKGGEYYCTVDLLFDWFGLVCFAMKAKNVSCHTAYSKPVKREVNGTVILPPVVYPGFTDTKMMVDAYVLICGQCRKTFYGRNLQIFVIS